MLDKTVLAGLVAGCLSGAAAAQGASQSAAPEPGLVMPAARLVETVSVTGLRPLALDAVTGSVSVLDAADLAVRLSANPADQLRAVPGIGVSRTGGPGSFTQVRIRGAEANHTLVLLDGIEVSDPVNGETDFGLLTGIGAARIEVLRGEASSIYGSDAIGGVVSLASSEGAGLRGLAEAGSFETLRAELSGGQVSAQGLSLSGAASAYSTGGVDTSGLGGEADGSEAFSVFGRAGYAFATGWQVNGLALLRQSTAESDPDSDFDGRLNDGDRETVADQYLVGVSAQGATGPVNHQLRASVGAVTRENSSETGLLDEATGERLKFSWSPRIDLAGGDLIGVADWESEDYTREDVEFGGFTDADETFETAGIAAEYRREIAGVDVSASARQDFNDGRFDDATTWRIGAGVDVGPRGRLRASAGTGVKNPTFTELFGFFPGSFIGNPDLVPEKSMSYEIGWDQQVGPAALSATYFSAELEDEIFTAFNPNFTATARNRDGTSERRGAEFSARAPLTPSLTASGQVTLTESENDTGADEVRVPDTTASLAIDWQTGWRGLQAGAALDYVGEQNDFDFGAFPARRVQLDAYTLLSARLDYPLTTRWSVTLRGENLLDQDATDVFGFNTPGAAAFVGLKLK